MGAKAYKLIEQVQFEPGECVVEIGAEKYDIGQGSTTFLRAFCSERNIPFFSVDVDPGIIGSLTMSGEMFLNHFSGIIKFAYLDNFDYIYPHMRKSTLVRITAERYVGLGLELNNANSQAAHLEQARLVHEHSVVGTHILFDDTYRMGTEMHGKGGTAVPFLKGLGYELLNDICDRSVQKDSEREYALLRRVS